jgi:hypothetical protein
MMTAATKSSEVFTGPDARQQAIRYAKCKFGAYDEIELEPYARADNMG